MIHIPVSKLLTPSTLFCAFAYNVGTLDYGFANVDRTIGPNVSSTTNLVLAPVLEALAPVHEQAAAGCGYTPLVAAPLSQVPPPVNRVDLLQLVCG